MQTTNLYYANKDRLSLLPQMFTGMVAVGFVLVSIVILNSFFYIEVIAENIPFFKTSVNYDNPESLLDAEENIIIQNRLSEANNPEGVKVFSNCYLKQSSQIPAGIIPTIERGTLWWEVSECNLDVKGIQVVNRPISDFELTNNTSYNLLVTKDNQFVIVYGTALASDLQLDEIAAISQNTNNTQSFALTIDSQRIGSQRISLVGSCIETGDECELWVDETFSNTSTQVSNQITSLSHQGKPLMEDYRYVQIARTQDEFPEVINLIYRNDFGSGFVFVRLDYTTGDVLQRILVTPEERDIYNRFYR